jgi:alanyl-tRNA synthetase
MHVPPRTSDEIRQAFIEFFEARGHVLLPPWPLVPIGDPTSLFTSAGMQQFKPHFLGEQEPPAPRAVTVQPCFRTTDIEEVGDLSHLTAFEMLGNFSFGDYFKSEAIAMAWELLTGVYRLDPARLHITIFLDDEVAFGAWRDVGVAEDHIHRCGEDKNYWFSFPAEVPGASGPCGPDSEIYFDHYPERGLDGIRVAYDDERFLEIWNLVFMELYQHPDGHRTRLPAQNIDTGSGLERVAAVLQGKVSVFETDIFLPILEAAAAVACVDYTGGKATDEQAYAIRAMAEHCRAATMLIGDGVVPSNEGRGYVLRRIMRRAIYFARKSGVTEPFTARLADAAIDKLKVGYPRLAENGEFIRKAMTAEEERFIRTLAAGSHRLEALLERLSAAAQHVVPGEEAFQLYDTFGLPRELTGEIAAARGFAVDEQGFEQALEAQRQRARQQATFLKGEPTGLRDAIGDDHSAFLGYEHVEAEGHLVALLKDGALAEVAAAGEACEVVLDATPFYPEGGGQLGDRGTLRTPSGVFVVEDTQTAGGAIVHRGRVTEGELRVGETVDAAVDAGWRAGAMRNHTGTHLLHASLRSILGAHVRQQGSLVTPERLRFDFTHLEHTPRAALLEVQRLANEKVREDLDVSWRTTSYRQAVSAGALAFFGDKYGNDVRVVEIREDDRTFSAELCGGTHVHRTGEIGFVHILRESAVAAGTRRIEALTGRAAEEHLVGQQERLLKIAERLSTAPADIEERIEAMQAELERLRRQGEELQRAQSAGAVESLLAGAARVGEAHVVVGLVSAGSEEALRDVADRVRARLSPSLVVLGANVEGRARFLVAATPDLVAKGVHAGRLIGDVAKAAGGGGGGRPDMATAGARDASRLEPALDEARRLATAAVAGG